MIIELLHETAAQAWCRRNSWMLSTEVAFLKILVQYSSSRVGQNIFILKNIFVSYPHDAHSQQI